MNKEEKILDVLHDLALLNTNAIKPAEIIGKGYKGKTKLIAYKYLTIRLIDLYESK